MLLLFSFSQFECLYAICMCYVCVFFCLLLLLLLLDVFKCFSRCWSFYLKIILVLLDTKITIWAIALLPSISCRMFRRLLVLFCEVGADICKCWNKKFITKRNKIVPRIFAVWRLTVKSEEKKEKRNDALRQRMSRQFKHSIYCCLSVHFEKGINSTATTVASHFAGHNKCTLHT